MLSKPTFRWLLIALGSACVVYVFYHSQATLLLLGLSFVVAYLLGSALQVMLSYPIPVDVMG